MKASVLHRRAGGDRARHRGGLRRSARASAHSARSSGAAAELQGHRSRSRRRSHRARAVSSARSSCTSPSWPSPMDNKANGTSITLGQDDTQLTPSLATTKTKRSSRRRPSRADRAGRQPGGRGGRAAVREGRHGVHLRLGDAAGADHQRREQDVLPRRPQRQRPGPAGRQLHRQPHSRPKGSTILIVDDQEAYSQGLVSVMIADPHEGRHTRSTTRATTAATPARRCRTTSRRRWPRRTSTATCTS